MALSFSIKPNPQKALDVVGVGSWTNFDHLFVVDRLPAPGDTVQIGGPIDSVESTFFGGCAPNNAATVARLGGKAGLIGVVGRDFVTLGYQKYFQQLGVELEGISIIDDDLCGHSFMYSDPDGNSICLSHLGVANRQEAYDPSANVLAETNVAVINYRFDRYTLRAANLVKDANGLVIVSGALMTAPTLAADFVQATDVLVCTDHELHQLTSHLELSHPEILLERGLRALIMTRGKQGSQIILSDGSVNVPICKPKRVVDTTGAGDSFVGAIAYGLAKGSSIVDAARLGSVVASFVVEAIGCQTNLPTSAQAAERYLEEFHEAPLLP